MKKLVLLFALALAPAFGVNSACDLSSTAKAGAGPWNWSSSATWTCTPEVLGITVTNAGTGYTAGTYALTFSGSCGALGTYTVTGTTVASAVITYAGYKCASATVSFPSGGGSSAAATLTLTGSVSTVPGDADTTCVGGLYWAPTPWPIVTLDTKVGTVAGGGIQTVCQTGWVLQQAAPSSQVGITFASTGNNPVGTCANSFTAPTVAAPCPNATMNELILGSNANTTVGLVENLTGTAPTAISSTCAPTASTSPTQFTCSSAHGLSSGQVIAILWATSGSGSWTGLNNHMFHVTVSDSTHFSVVFNSSGYTGSFDGQILEPSIFITTADEASPIAIQKSAPLSGGYGNLPAVSFTLKYVAINNLGTPNTADGNSQGIFITDQFLSGSTNPLLTVDVEHCLILNYYALVRTNLESGSGGLQSITWKYNLTAGANNVGGLQLNDAVGTLVTDNVDISPVSSGNGYYLNTPAQQFAQMDFERNLVRGTAAIGRSLVITATAGIDNGSTGQNLYKDNICSNWYSSTTVFPTSSGGVGCMNVAATTNSASTGIPALIDGLVVDGGYGSGNTGGSSAGVSLTNTFISAGPGPFVGGVQGLIETTGAPLYVSNSVVVIDSRNNGEITTGVFSYSLNSVMTIDNFVFDGGPYVNGSQGLQGSALQFGEEVTNAYSVNSAARSSIVLNQGSQNTPDSAINDCHRATCLSSTYLADTVGANAVGIHNNWTFSDYLTYYWQGTANHFQTSGTAHPNATYGDVNGGTGMFVDTTRRLAGYDAVLGGPGTEDHFTFLIAGRTGWAGPCTVACSSITDGGYGALNDNIFRAALKWLMRGYVSNNPVSFGAGWNGATVSSLPGTCTPHAANDVVWYQSQRYQCINTNWTVTTTADIGLTVPAVQRMPVGVMVQ